MIRHLLHAACGLVLASASIANAANVGDVVLGYWAPNDAYFVGTVAEQTAGGWLVVFDDGDNAVLGDAQIRPYNLQVGSSVWARWLDGRYYKGKIAKAVGRAFFIHYDDGDKLWAPTSSIIVK